MFVEVVRFFGRLPKLFLSSTRRVAERPTWTLYVDAESGDWQRCSRAMAWMKKFRSKKGRWYGFSTSWLNF